jgi:hypothetical protein
MNLDSKPRLWATFGVSITALVGLGLLMVFLSRGPGAPTPIVASPVPTIDEDPTVASVNGRPIKHSFWMQAALLDQVLSGIAGQPAPASDETLQRLINEDLLLSAFPPEQPPTTDQIEAQIARLEDSWRVSDDAVNLALDNAGLDRPAFVQAIGRLLIVQASLDALQAQGYHISTWLEEQRASAEIVLDAELGSVVAAQLPASPTPPQTVLSTATMSPIPTPMPTSTSVPLIDLSPLSPPTPPMQAIPEIAPDFTLARASGGSFTLSEQLAQGPVVLVFFQKCG